METLLHLPQEGSREGNSSIGIGERMRVGDQNRKVILSPKDWAAQVTVDLPVMLLLPFDVRAGVGPMAKENLEFLGGTL